MSLWLNLGDIDESNPSMDPFSYFRFRWSVLHAVQRGSDSAAFLFYSPGVSVEDLSEFYRSSKFRKLTASSLCSVGRSLVPSIFFQFIGYVQSHYAFVL